MTKIKDRSLKTKKRIAREIRDYHIQVKAALENLRNDGTITVIEFIVVDGTHGVGGCDLLAAREQSEH
jgi:hypothetical protein